ncbi:P-loop containing nucleoside triphosphate hydrolase [Glarea lozoyensis ATCC 20868]|uniref:p-loop containing nucleoside triphosphate hydrolase n=1 Tax=Glarea lozoyensis (strain ATCC 20868 / MF5171) TaxID=1116229 RepID=S3CE78_GLAL2|nr:P-loop containing nucleoside triphosphate hydrolase [Glarea lozoyensis ATCC 20868]EPE24772.1 P-loop containing nucleoside triphosphate hydrolase [Glarea lozoyensis ATCC 20868]
MAILSQCWTLTRKNILIALHRHTISTVVRAFLLPIAFVIFLSYARNLFIPPSSYGIGTSTPIRTLAEGLDAANGGRDTVAFVNNGLAGGDIDRIIDSLAQTVSDSGKKVARLNTQTDLLETCRSSLRGSTRCYGGVVFLSSPNEGTGGIWNYTLRADGSFGTRINVDKSTNEVQVYLLPLQRAVDEAIVNLNGTTTALPAVEAYPYTSLTQEQRNTSIRVNYQGAIINILAVAFLIGMVGVSYHLTGFIASERELGMSQLIEAMMPNLQRWKPQFARIISYHIAFDLMYIPGWIIIGIVFGVGIFAETSMAIVIVYHILAGLALTSLSILGASFFKKAQLSGITVAIVVLLLGVVSQVVGVTSNGAVVILSLLFTPCNYVFSLIFMARYERQRMATDLLHAAPANPWTIPGIVLWVFVILQIFIYPLLGAWVERSLYGTASKGRSVVGNDLSENETVRLEEFTKHYPPTTFRRWTSRFSKTPKETVIAVNKLNLSARKGQICVLLGANGSGKSTTLDSIAGLNTVTSGNITVNGTGGLGIAPQKNVLWDELTVEEHIRIFNHLKSPGHRDSKATIRELVDAVDLGRKISAKSKTLSGGQKRKLQLGMMFTGGSAVCCVDEVSSGLDPLSRRKIWDILLAERGSRTIILTTHFLDEADLLADQIAILSKGTLRAHGSSVELKEKLGGGYRVHLQSSPGHASPPDIDGVTKHATFGQAMYTASSSTQAAYIIRHLEALGLTDYQLSGPTIEDVFLQLADEVRSEELGSVSSLGRDSVSETPEPNDKNGNVAATARPARKEMELRTGQRIGPIRQCWVLFRKRFTILRRNWLPYVAVFLLPVIAAGLTTLFLKNFNAVGCAPQDTARVSDVESLTTINALSTVVGPASRLSVQTIRGLFQPMLPIPIPPQDQLQPFINTVDTLTQFNDYINSNFSFTRPAAFFLGDASSPATLAFRGNGGIYNGVFGQNILNTVLSNISISTQYSEFDVPWSPSTGDSLQLVVYFGLAMAAYPGFFSLYPTFERTRKIRELEYSNGVRSLPLWLAYLGFDFLFVLVTSALSVIIFAVTSPDAWYHVGYLFVIFTLFGMASILFAYVVSLFARTQLSAYAFAAAGQAVLFLCYLIAYLCTLTYAPINKIDDLIIVVHFTISLVTPMGSLIRALFVALNLFSTTCSGRELASYPGGILQYGGPILYLIVQVFVLFAILLWYDSGSILAWYRRVRGKPAAASLPRASAEEGEPAAEDLARINSSNDGLRVLNLTKSFKTNTAVDNLTFGIKRGEVFALLGPNGAGKSTTISLIRGDIQPSKNGGSIYVENVDIGRQRAKARGSLGVTPQFDAMDAMTTREHLIFYARIRGVPDVEHNVEEVIKAVGLQAFTERMAVALSGGNKRKLSLGIALIGNPTVLLLDEPSSGMDAAAKRVMWQTLASVVPGRSLLLTTHSMEEADALADRAGIMAKRMLASGTSDHLREVHGGAYYVHLVMKSAPHTTDEEISALIEWVRRTFPGADVEDKTYHGQIRFSVPARQTDDKSKFISKEEDLDSISGSTERATDTKSGIGSIITTLEDHREELGLEHYGVSPTTLDQVFLSIVQKHDVEEEGYAVKKKGRRSWRSGWLVKR